jgi:hypothetical protein
VTKREKLLYVAAERMSTQALKMTRYRAEKMMRTKTDTR